MILADTSVWIDHLRFGVKDMREYLGEAKIVTHPLIVAELALGSLRDRASTLRLLDRLPHLQMASAGEVRGLIETRRLFGLGIGVTDASLIASVLISPPALLWTRDKRLRTVAQALNIHAMLA